MTKKNSTAVIMNAKRRLVALRRERLRRRAQAGDFMAFVQYCNTKYKANWHHQYIAKRLEDFLKSDTEKRLMLFMPPQHGKSELASRNLPAFALGLNPDLKIAACSYSASLARTFNRDVQRVMDNTPHYVKVFPDTRLPSRRTTADSRNAKLRNTNEFEIVGHDGSYMSVGVGGSLSGRPVDLLIIDDPVKDAKAAMSEVIRSATKEWYDSVAETRLHNDSKVIIIMTRWHEMDLCGQLLKEEPDEWTVVSIPAIKDTEGAWPGEGAKYPVGSALWPQKHSLKRLLKKQRKSAWVFTALFQQRPSPIGGGAIKGRYFRRFSAANIPPGPVRFYLDTAYTEKQKNDETAILVYKIHRNKMYILHSAAVRMEFPELVKWIPLYVKAAGYTPASTIKVEPKASGISVVQELQRHTGLNIEEAPAPQGSKEERVNAISPTLSAGNVFLIKPPADDPGAWQAAFISQCEAFPNGGLDDRVGTLEGSVRNDLHQEGWDTITRTN